MVVGQLSVILGLAVNRGEWQKGHAHINHFRRVALAFGAVFGGRILGKALVGFNTQMETSKNQIASMLAMTKNTSVTDELINANKLYGLLRAEAAELPGDTQDYVNMLSLLVQPMAKAKMTMQEMSDMTVAAKLTAAGWGDTWQAAARDIGEYINFGKINKVDRYLRKLLDGTKATADPKGREYSEKLGIQGRTNLLKGQYNKPQVGQMKDLMKNSFEGKLEAIKDRTRIILGEMGEGLFSSMKGSLDKLDMWLQNNQAMIKVWAANVGAHIAGAFEAMQSGVGWLIEHEVVLTSVLLSIGMAFFVMMTRALAAWLVVAWPMLAGAGVVFAIRKIAEVSGFLATVLGAVALAAALAWKGLLGPAGWAAIVIGGVIAAFYYFKDEVAAVLGWVYDKIMWVFDKFKEAYEFIFGGPGLSDMMKAIETGDLTLLTGGGNKPVAPTRTDGAGATTGPSVNVTGSTIVHIQTDDVTGAKKAFDKAIDTTSAAAMRNANHHFGGKQ